MEQGAIGQVGQRIVMRQMTDLLFGARTLGNIVVGGEAAVFQRLIGDLHRASFAGLESVASCLSERDVALDRGNKGLDVTFERPDLLAIQKEVAEVETGL